MYIEHYGLLGRPFQLTPDARFYFDSATHKKAMAYLGYGLSQGEGFIVITGEIGSGKTTLVEHLKHTIDRSRLTAINVVSTQVEGEDMLRSVAQQLGIQTSELAKAEVLGAVEQALHAEARQGRRVLLIVDEAQNLPFSAIEELRMLSNFQLGPESLVQIFLLGQPEFRDRLNHDPKLEQVRQRVIATHHLEPIGADEIEGYLVHRLAACGWNGNPDFTPEAVALMHHQSGGVPRLINILAGRVMLHGAIEDLTVIDGNAVRAVIVDLDHGMNEDENELPFDAPDEGEAEFDGPEFGYEKLMVKAEPKTPIQFEEPVGEPIADPVIIPFAQDHGGYSEEIAPMNDDYQEGAWQPEVDPVAADHWVVERQVEMPEEQVLQTGEPNEPEFHPTADMGDVMTDKLAELEARIEEQDAALRRVLTLLVDWAEDERKPFPDLGELKGFAA